MANFDRDIYFNGRNMQSFGWYITKNTPIRYSYKPKYVTTPIVGSINGEGIVERDKTENTSERLTFKTIPEKMPFDSEEMFLKTFEKWLRLNQGKYGKFIDTSKKGCYTEAIITEVSDIERPYKGCFKVSITFSCKPFYYLEQNDKITSTTVANTEKEIVINNFEDETAYPYIKITKTGTSQDNLTPIMISTNDNPDLIIIDDETITISSIEIDSESMRVYSGDTSLDYLVQGVYLPEFVSEENTLVITTNTNANVEIFPRWRCI